MIHRVLRWTAIALLVISNAITYHSAAIALHGLRQANSALAMKVTQTEFDEQLTTGDLVFDIHFEGQERVLRCQKETRWFDDACRPNPTDSHTTWHTPNGNYVVGPLMTARSVSMSACRWMTFEEWKQDELMRERNGYMDRGLAPRR